MKPIAIHPVIELWRDVPGYEGYYEVSNRGQVKSLERVVRCGSSGTRIVRQRILKPATNRNGHQLVLLCIDTNHRTHRIHQLVMLGFVGPRPNGLEVCHNNGIGSDNRLSNLRYDTHLSNMRDRVKHGVDPNASKTHCDHGHEFTPENTAPVRRKGRAAVGRYCRECHRAKSRRNYWAARNGIVK